MEIFLVLNGYEIKATIDEQEKVIMDIAAGQATEYYKANSLKQH